MRKEAGRQEVARRLCHHRIKSLVPWADKTQEEDLGIQTLLDIRSTVELLN